MPVCTAFTKQSKPCTSHIYTHERTLCGIHLPMISTPELEARFNREQAVLRANWQGLQAGTHVRVGNKIVPIGQPLPAGVRERPPPPPRRPCISIKADGTLCNQQAKHDDQRCNLHHAVALRHIQNELLTEAKREIRNIYGAFRFNTTVYTATIAEVMPRLMEGLNEQNQRRLREHADELYIRPFLLNLSRILNRGATFAQADAHVQAWVTEGIIPLIHVPRLQDFITRQIAAREWRDQVNNPQQFGAHQREAQLAADSQNVHTREITQQMRDSINILLEVKVPPQQVSTMSQIREHMIDKGYPVYEINTVYRDVVNWWNKPTIFSENDKLYKRLLRALWWTINQYKPEVREELHKRLWEELKDGAIPYSVCTQGHIARLSNVMIGFDEAFVPPVPVGDILQQKMAAIYAMDVDYEEQMRLAEAVLEELKIPREQHKDWLSAF